MIPTLQIGQTGLAIAVRAASVPGIIDAYTANLWGAYGLVKLVSGASSAIRVRESSGNTEADIGFTSLGALDTTALLAHCGANNGFVVTWYDQSGLGNSITNSTTGEQPQIVKAGVYLGEIVWDGTNDVLISTGHNSGAVPAFSAYIAGRNRYVNQAADGRILFHQSGPYLTTQNDAAYTIDRHGVRIFNDQSSNGFARYDHALTDDHSTYTAVWDRSQASVATECVLYRNGSAMSQISTSGSTTSSNYTAGVWRVGAGGTGGVNPEALACQALLIYEAAHSGATLSAIAALIRPAERVGQLDSYLTNAWSIVSLRKQRSAYAGSCFRLRDVTADTETDIGFDANGVVDWAAAISYLAGHTGVVAKFYDQSGNGNHFSQATESKMPVAVVAGVPYYDGFTYDTARVLISDNNSGTPSAVSTFVKTEANSHIVAVILELSPDFNTNTGCVAPMYNNDPSFYAMQELLSNVSSANMVASRYANVALAGNVIGSRMDRSAGTAAAKTSLFSGGKLIARTHNADAGTPPSGNFTAQKWHLGGRGTTPSAAFSGTLHTAVIYEAAITDANCDEISRRLG